MLSCTACTQADLHAVLEERMAEISLLELELSRKDTLVSESGWGRVCCTLMHTMLAASVSELPAREC
jgi:hypothetical protein